MSGAGGDWNAIGVFGGTFDPVHFGHLRTAFECRARLGLSEVRFIPCAEPPHRDSPDAPAGTRLQMLEAATAGVDGFVVDGRELQRTGPSWSIDTLRSLREEFPEKVLCLLLGLDAFAGFTQWREWRSILDLAHVVVARRPGAPAPSEGEVGRLLDARWAHELADLRAARHGRIHIVDVTQLEISSTQLRRSIADGLSPVYLLPDAVWKIIKEARCYVP